MSELVNVTEYDAFRAKLDEVKEVCNFLPDTTSDEGYQKSKRVSLDVGKVLTSLDKTRKELKSDALEFGRKVDSEAKGIREALEEIQGPHKEAYKKLDNAKKEREQARKDELERRIEEIRNLPEFMRDMDSGSIRIALEDLNKEECLDFYEYATPALTARNAARLAMTTLFAEKLKSEQDAMELYNLKKEAAEREQKDRDDRIAREAADKASIEAEKKAKAEQDKVEQDKVDKERLEAIERQNKAKAKLIAAERQLIASENLAKIEEEKRLRLEEASRIARQEAEAKAKQDAIDAAEDAKQAQIDKFNRIEAEEKALLEKREANKRHVGAVRKKAKEALMGLGFKFTEEQAKIIILAIDSNQIPNVKINY